MATAEMIRRHETVSLERMTSHAPHNVGEAERLASKVGGGVLVGVGLTHGGWSGVMMAALGAALWHRGSTGHCHLYQAIGADTTGHDEHGSHDSVPALAGTHVVESMTIGRSADDLFRFWRDYANLPRFMSDIESVTPTDPSGMKSHWVAKGLMGKVVEWDAEIHNETPGELIAWRSTGGDLQTAGSVHFQTAPGGQGTEVRVEQKINPPGGNLGVAVAKLLGHGFAAVTKENLRRLKQIMEAGEVATVSGQTSGRA
jgi:uncharacterized membrane protein